MPDLIFLLFGISFFQSAWCKQVKLFGQARHVRDKRIKLIFPVLRGNCQWIYENFELDKNNLTAIQRKLDRVM